MYAFLRVVLAPFRWAASLIIRFADRSFQPVAISRSPEKQAEVDGRTAALKLYHFEACPFCVKVRRHVRALSLNIEQRDVKRVRAYHDELLAGGGEIQVPCLRISEAGKPDRWMYESSDINAYLTERFGAP